MKERLSLASKIDSRRNAAAVLDGFFLLRPTLIFPLWTMVLAGHRLAGEGEVVGALRWSILAVALTALFGLVYLLNQMRDREGDLHNGKSLLISHDLISRRSQIMIGIVLGVMAPSALIASGFGHLGLWMAATFAVAGLLYNYTPVALERTPYGGIVSGAAGGWLLLKLGEKIAGSEAGPMSEIPYVLAFTAGCLLTSLPDLQGDRETGKRTFAVAFGELATVICAGSMIFAAGVISLMVNDWVMTSAAAAGTVLIVTGLAKGRLELAVAGNKVAIFLLALGVAFNYPWFLAAIAIYLPLARWYHRVRFGLDYPNFRGEYASQSAGWGTDRSQ